MWWFYCRGPSGFSGTSAAEEVTASVDGRSLVAVIIGTLLSHHQFRAALMLTIKKHLFYHWHHSALTKRRLLVY
ncbi:hypothetical protein PR202_ga07750 [Eleusine coracana subsp. coracana]|uniref:Uncharacterized protein n=1 Tax=Eleusine coracana subsp. coracana TaxID=191504 RepID=A0AAV5BYU6_ELECO|nr:hypothetical protein PR202_ga07750 [Eleusine coracana subsp. coracana]